MLPIDEIQLANAIRSAFPGLGDSGSLKRARDLLADTDPRLAPNINEWLQGGPVSDIRIGKYSINAIMAIRGERDFLSALEAMNLYLRDSAGGERLISRARR